MTIPDVATETLHPSSIDELAAMVRAHNRRAIYPVGCGSWQDLGYPPTKPGVAISTKGLNRVVDYPHEELTITVEAGILISDLQRILAEKGQMLPIDCPHPENATLGGLLATNTSGPRRLAYGTARDSVLGLDVIDATGTRIHGGGRVVKNVAGYDLPKMHIGALGIIVEATLKVRPLPEATESMMFAVNVVDLNDCLQTIRKSKLKPVAVEIESPNSLGGDYLIIQVFFEDCAEAVLRQREVAESFPRTFVRAPTDHVKLEDFAAIEEPTHSRNEVQASADRMAFLPCAKHELGMGAKLCVQPTHIASLVRQLFGIREIWKIKAHAMNGIVWVYWREGEAERAKESVSNVRKLSASVGGRFTIPRCPADWKRELPIWGDVGPEIEWMRRLRTALDPHRTLNPGRFVVE